MDLKKRKFIQMISFVLFIILGYVFLTHPNTLGISEIVGTLNNEKIWLVLFFCAAIGQVFLFGSNRLFTPFNSYCFIGAAIDLPMGPGPLPKFLFIAGILSTIFLTLCIRFMKKPTQEELNILRKKTKDSAKKDLVLFFIIFLCAGLIAIAIPGFNFIGSIFCDGGVRCNSTSAEEMKQLLYAIRFLVFSASPLVIVMGILMFIFFNHQGNTNKLAEEPPSSTSTETASETEAENKPEEMPTKPYTDSITPLLQACMEGDFSALKSLLPSEQINQIYKGNGNTALHIAVWNNYPYLVELLLEQPNIDTQIKNAAGKTALDLAEEKNLTEIIDLLTFTTK